MLSNKESIEYIYNVAKNHGFELAYSLKNLFEQFQSYEDYEYNDSVYLQFVTPDERNKISSHKRAIALGKKRADAVNFKQKYSDQFISVISFGDKLFKIDVIDDSYVGSVVGAKSSIMETKERTMTVIVYD